MRKSQVKKVKKVLCYIDLSKPSHHVVEYANMVAQCMGAELFVLHTVTDIKRSAGFYVPHINTDKLEEEMTKAAQDKLYAVCMQSIGDIDPSRRIVKRGDVLEVIDDMIDSLDIDLLIFGHEVGALTIFKNDYITKYLKAPGCPVLAVPIKGE
jgi:nucleotide-binding universal stress UspA family protein